MPDSNTSSPDMEKQVRALKKELNRCIRNADKLKKRETYFKGILEAFDGLVYVCAPDNRIEFVNHHVISKLGRDVTGETCHEAIHGYKKPCPWCREQPAFQGQNLRYEYQSPSDGRWYYHIATPIIHPDGSVSKLTLSIDISEKKIGEEALRESQRKLQTLMNNLPGMVYRCKSDETYTMEFASKGSIRLLGYDPHELLNDGANAYYTVVHPDDRKNILKQVSVSLKENRPFSFIYRVRTEAGQEKWVWEQGEGVHGDDGKLVALEGFITDVTAHKEVELDLRQENMRLRSSIRDRYRFGRIIGKSKVMQDVYELILRAAATHANVIIYGESGTGKELVAQEIHELSDRKTGEFVAVNCGAIPEALLESEFFGHRKGAFTGASSDTRGYLDVADGGTIFLDELGEISMNMQAKLLRILEGKGYRPVGGTQLKTSNFRVLAATNKDLIQMVNDGKIREDFFYRIHILPIHLPPLRERKEDIPLLIDHFIEQSSVEGSAPPFLSMKIRQAMHEYDWPGNVRELQNVMNSYFSMGKLDFLGKITATDVSARHLYSMDQVDVAEHGLQGAMAAFEKKLIIKTLEEEKWNRGRAADRLKLNPRTLYRKIADYKLN